jgi:hypothetical protein
MVDPAARARSRWRRPAEIAATLLLGAVLGWTAHELAGADGGRSPSPPTRAGDSAASHPPDPEASSSDRDAETVDFWAATALASAARSGRIEALLEEIESRNLDPRTSIEQAIAESSDQDLATVLSAVTRIDEEELLAAGDLRPFASRLVDVALDGLAGPSSEPEPSRRVLFTATTGGFDPESSSQSTFPTDQGRIFARIELGDHDGDRVLVKWLNADTRRVHSLQSMAYDPDQPLWSFLARDADWDRGRYEVSFYSQDSKMTLLGRGAFTIF